jgi:phosphoserine phosphatase RsbU/P
LGNRLQEINRPLASLTQAAEALRNDEFKPELLESLKSDAGRFKHFAYVFEGMANEITSKMRLRQEMQMAQDIQQAFLPSVHSAPHEDADYQISAEMIAAKHVGGDFFDYFAINEDKLGIVIGDVSGKGVPAALFMAASRTVVKTTALLELPPAECLTRVNATIAEDNEEMMFVTLFYGVVDIKTGRLTYCNGGHNPAYILGGGTAPHPLPPTGGAIGISETMKYEQAEIDLEPHQTLFLYTDGVTESVHREGHQFTEKRLAELLNKNQALETQALVQFIQNEVNVFAEGLDRFDDTTCLAFSLQHSD